MIATGSDFEDTDVTVVIPTLAARGRPLERAIASIVAQEGITARPLVVVNGARAAPDILEALRADARIRLVQIPEAGVSAARLAGRKLVETDFFAFLDDDDELLPRGLARAVEALRLDSTLAAFIANGYRETGGVRSRCFDGFSDHTDDALMDLVRENWLSSAGGVYRSAAVTADILADLPDHLEMTLFAFRLAANHKIVRVDENAFIVHEDATGRASQTLQYHLKEPDVIRRMEALAKEPALAHALGLKRAAALHHCSGVCRQHGHYWRAWAFHLRSLFARRGWRYVPATRHLFRLRKRA